MRSVGSIVRACIIPCSGALPRGRQPKEEKERQYDRFKAVGKGPVCAK